MARLGSIILIVGLLVAVGWTARHESAADKAAVVIDADWAAAHTAQLRRALNLTGDIGLEFKEAGDSPVADYRLFKFDLVTGERRRPLALYVSRDGQRLLFDRVYELADPFKAYRDRITVAGSPARGPADAPVTIVEYSDYTCGYCRQFFDTTEEELFVRYGPQVRLVVKNYPLIGVRAWSGEAALAGACAYRQGEEPFWKLHAKLFGAPARLKEGRPTLVELAQGTGLDRTAFESCLENGDARADIERDVQEGESVGVEGTPTFFVNGRPVPGLLPAEDFFALVDEELAAATRQ